MIISHISGIDSFIANIMANEKYGDTHPVYYDYGQPFIHKEYDVLKKIMDIEKREIKYCDSIPFLPNPDLPGRDAVMCIASAIHFKPDMIIVGTSPDDNYGDTQPEYFFYLNRVIRLMTGMEIEVVRPLFDLNMTKKDALKWAIDHGVSKPVFESLPSCTENSDGACLKCNKCCFNWASFTVNGLNYGDVFKHEEALEKILEGIQFNNSLFIDAYNKYTKQELDDIGAIMDIEKRLGR